MSLFDENIAKIPNKTNEELENWEKELSLEITQITKRQTLKPESIKNPISLVNALKAKRALIVAINVELKSRRKNLLNTSIETFEKIIIELVDELKIKEEPEEIELFIQEFLQGSNEKYLIYNLIERKLLLAAALTIICSYKI